MKWKHIQCAVAPLYAGLAVLAGFQGNHLAAWACLLLVWSNLALNWRPRE